MNTDRIPAFPIGLRHLGLTWLALALGLMPSGFPATAAPPEAMPQARAPEKLRSDPLLSWEKLLLMTGPEGPDTRYMRDADGDLKRVESRYRGDLLVAVTEVTNGFRITLGNDVAVADFSSRPWFTAAERDGLIEAYGAYVAREIGSKLWKTIGRFKVVIEADPDFRSKLSFVLLPLNIDQQLPWSQGLPDDLDRRKTLSLQEARAIVQYETDVTLDGLESLSPEVAAVLATHTRRLALNGITFISDELADAIGHHKVTLKLNGLTSLSPKAAKSLARQEVRLELNGLTSLSDEAAEALATSTGYLALNGLVTLSNRAAVAFSKKGGLLELDGVTALSDFAAENLASHFNGNLSLRGLSEVSARANKALRANASIHLPAIMANAPSAAGSFTETLRLASDRQQPEPSPLRLLSLSPDGSLVAAISGPWMQVWSTATGDRVSSVPHPGVAGALHWLPDSQRLMTVSWGNTRKVRLFDAKKGEVIASADASASEASHARMALSANGAMAATAVNGAMAATAVGRDLTVIVWDTATLKHVSKVTEKGHFVRAVEFSPTAELLATAGATDLNLWDPTSGESKGTLRGHTDIIRDVAFSPDGTKVVTGGSDKTARIWSVESREATAFLRGHSEQINDVCFSANGRFVATASDDGTAAIWHSEGGELIAKWEVRDGVRFGRCVQAVAFSPDNTMFAAESEAGRVAVWDVATKFEIKAFDYSKRFITGFHANGFAFFPQCDRIVLVESPAEAVVWKLMK